MKTTIQTVINNSKTKFMKQTFFTFLVIALFGVFLTGCQQDDMTSNMNEDSIPTHQSLLKSSDIISDKDFYYVLSGRTQVPTDVIISDYVKRKILFEDQGLEQVAIDALKPIITKDILNDMEKEAEFYQNSSDYNKEIPYPRYESSKNNQIVSSKSSITGSKIISSVPHCYQFNTIENPNGYYWCGHSNLKSVGMYHGVTKSMGTLHNPIFWNNSSAYRSGRCTVGGVQKYCASMLDLLYAAKLTNNGGYGWSATTTENISTLGPWYQKFKDGVDYNKPAIVASTYLYSVGHFYTVIGYTQYSNSDGSIDYVNSKFFLRDNARSTPIPTGERVVSAQTFFNYRTGNDILIIRPGGVLS